MNCEYTLLVFTVTPSQIEIKTVHWITSGASVVKGGKYTKTPTKIQVRAIFPIFGIFVDMVYPNLQSFV